MEDKQDEPAQSFETDLTKDISALDVLHAPPAPSYRRFNKSQLHFALFEAWGHTIGPISQIIYDYCYISLDIKLLLIESAEAELKSYDDKNGVDIRTYLSIIKSLPSVLLMSGGMHQHTGSHDMYIRTCDNKAYAYSWRRGDTDLQIDPAYVRHGCQVITALANVLVQFPGIPAWPSYIEDDNVGDGYFYHVPVHNQEVWVHSLARPE